VTTYVLRQVETPASPPAHTLRRTVVAAPGFTPGDYLISPDFDRVVAIERAAYDVLKAGGQTDPKTLYVLVVPEP
jgi:hypothetical protein